MFTRQRRRAMDPVTGSELSRSVAVVSSPPQTIHRPTRSLSEGAASSVANREGLHLLRDLLHADSHLFKRHELTPPPTPPSSNEGDQSLLQSGSESSMSGLEEENHNDDSINSEESNGSSRISSIASNNNSLSPVRIVDVSPSSSLDSEIEYYSPTAAAAATAAAVVTTTSTTTAAAATVESNAESENVRRDSAGIDLLTESLHGGVDALLFKLHSKPLIDTPKSVATMNALEHIEGNEVLSSQFIDEQNNIHLIAKQNEQRMARMENRINQIEKQLSTIETICTKIFHTCASSSTEGMVRMAGIKEPTREKKEEHHDKPVFQQHSNITWSEAEHGVVNQYIKKTTEGLNAQVEESRQRKEAFNSRNDLYSQYLYECNNSNQMYQPRSRIMQEWITKTMAQPERETPGVFRQQQEQWHLKCKNEKQQQMEMLVNAAEWRQKSFTTMLDNIHVHVQARGIP
jgi:hypothetical protein